MRPIQSPLLAGALALTAAVVGGCSRISLPAWHQTAVMRHVHTSPVAPFESPVDLSLDGPRPTGSGSTATLQWTFASPVIQTAKQPGFNEALVSWNIRLADGAAAAIELIVADDVTGGWSRPLRVATLGEAVLLGSGVDQLVANDRSRGFIDIDYFRSDEHYRSARVLITVVAPAGLATDTAPAHVDRISVCLSNTRDRRSVSAASLTGADRARKCRNDVPFRSQRTDKPDLSGRLCSPTSLAMVLAFHGADHPVQHVAALVRDPIHDIYGNWPLNIDAAYRLGIPGFLTRFGDWDSVATHLERGEPIIASIRAPRGVLRNAPYKQLDSGHLIVLTGLDGRGGVMVNDPAAATLREGRRVYSMAELSKAWMDLANGTAYVLVRPPPERQSGKAP